MAEIPDEARTAYEQVTGETLPPPADKPPDDSPPEGAPRKRRERSDKGVPRGPRGSRKAASTAQIERKLRELVNTSGALVSFVEPFDGSVIIANADNLAASWAKVADRHPKFRNAIEGLEAGGVYGAAVLSVLVVAIPILGHHGMLPPQFNQLGAMFTPPPNGSANGNGSVPGMG